MHGADGQRGWHPCDVRRMSLPELTLALDPPGKPRPVPGAVTFRTEAERAAYVERWRAMTPRERLDAARSHGA